MVQNTARIAIIDDDAAVRTATSRLLRSLGYAVETFGSAEQFLVAGSLGWDCLISDVRMPGMSGVDLQARLIEGGCRTPIIFMTAFPEESVRARALGAGAHAYLAKPCREGSLVDCLKSALGRQPAPA